MKRILSIEDNGQDLETVLNLLREHGYAAHEVIDEPVVHIAEHKRVEETIRESEKRFRLIVETAQEGIWHVDRDWKIIYVNRRMEQMLGYEPGSVPGLHLRDFMDDEGRRALAELIARSDQGIRETHDFRFVRRDGSRIDTLVSASPLVDELGCFAGSFAMVTDITERKRAETELRFSQYIIDKAEIGIMRGNAEGKILFANEYWAGLLGYTPEELSSMSFFDIDPNLTPESWLEHREKLTATGSNNFESVHRRKDGTVFPVEVTVNYLKFVGQVFSCSFTKDITERKRAEEALMVSERKYRAIIEHAPFGISRSTREGELLSVNPTLARILKYDSPEQLLEIVNRSSIKDVLFEDPSLRDVYVKRIFAGDSWNVFENRYRCKDDSVITCKVHARRILGNEGDGREFESFLENITERLEAETALRESEEKFRVLAETSPTAIFLYQGEMIVYANPATERLFGYGADELLRMSFWDWAHDDFKELVRDRGRARLRGEPVPNQYESRFVSKAGEDRWLVVSAGLIDYHGRATGVASLLDITEIKKAEQQLQTSLAEKEVLLKEVHHRVKNNLQIISSLLELQSDYITDDRSCRILRESQDRIKSMALIHERLYESRDLASINLAAYIDDLCGHLFHSYFADPGWIRLKVDAEDMKLSIDKAIPCGLIINELVSNCLKHAFPDGRDGEINIRLHAGSGNRITLSVADNGVGLPPDLDFRKTGTLGLQLVNMLTKQLQGHLETQNDHGATFTLWFQLCGC